MANPVTPLRCLLADAVAGGRSVAQHRPWQRVEVDRGHWQALATELAAGRLTLLGLWGERAAVHMALIDETAGDVAVATCPVLTGPFLRSAACMRRRSGRSGRFGTCSGSPPPACPMNGRGSTMAAGASRIHWRRRQTL